MAKRPVIEFQKLSPGIYKILTQDGLAGAIMDWGGASALQLPQKFMPIVRTCLPATFKFELMNEDVLYNHVLITQQNVPGWDDVVPKPSLFFQGYPDALAYINRINHPLVQELLKDPSLLDRSIAFMEGYVPGTDVAVQLNELAIALSDGKHYAYCCIGECTWSGRVKIDASKDFYECPECGELAEIRKV